MGIRFVPEKPFKIKYISITDKRGLFEDFQKIWGHIIEVVRDVHMVSHYMIIDSTFNRILFDRVGADTSSLIGKRIVGNKCIVIKELDNNQAAAKELLRREK